MPYQRRQPLDDLLAAKVCVEQNGALASDPRGPERKDQIDDCGTSIASVAFGFVAEVKVVCHANQDNVMVHWLSVACVVNVGKWGGSGLNSFLLPLPSFADGRPGGDRPRREIGQTMQFRVKLQYLGHCDHHGLRSIVTPCATEGPGMIILKVSDA
jgi:hypothetical protein